MANENENSPETPEVPETPETPEAPATPAKVELEKIVGPDAAEFLRKYLPTILVSAGLAVAVALGFGAWQNHKQGQIERAERLLSGQPMPEEHFGAGITMPRLQMVVDRYPNTPAAPLALLSLAAQFFSNGQYEPARSAYLTFEQLYPQHLFAPAAELGRIRDCSRLAARLGLRALAGHGLNLHNVGPVVAVPEIEELNIGHSIVGRAILVGFEAAVREMLAALGKGAG